MKDERILRQIKCEDNVIIIDLLFDRQKGRDYGTPNHMEPQNPDSVGPPLH